MSDRRIARQWGTNIKTWRKARGLTVSQFARELEVSRPAVYDWESGKAAPTPERHLDIARVLQVPPQVVFTYPEQAA